MDFAYNAPWIILGRFYSYHLEVINGFIIPGPRYSHFSEKLYYNDK
jgi:hypothetical protein